MSAAPALSTVELDANVVAVPRLRFTYVGPVRRGHVFSLRTEHRDLEVYISQTGRSVRVWSHDEGRELL